MTIRQGAVMGVLALSMVAMVAAYRLGRARADGVPMVNPLYYGGMLDDGGRPIEGARNVTVRLWDAATAGAAVCTTNSAGTVFSGGRFRVALNGACVGAVRANPELWAELQVDTTTFPRSKLGAVPYALEAGRATGAAGALEARLAAVEGRAAGGRQVVIGNWRPATLGEEESVSFPCPPTLPSDAAYYPVTGAPFSLTFVASASALYRVSATGRGDNNGVRIGSIPSVVPVFPRANDGTYSFNAIYQLEAGRSYTFVVEASVSPSGTNCGGTVRIHALRPITAEQLN